jgi:hypothetical protein
MLRLAWVNGSLFAVGTDGSKSGVWVSGEGSTWERRTLPPASPGATSGQAQGVAGDATGLVAVGWVKSGRRQSAAVWRSTDGGASWNAAPDQGDFHGSSGDTLMNRVAIVRQGVVVAVGKSGNDARVWPSADGVTWDRATNPVFDANPGHSLALRDVAEANGTLIAVGEESSGGTNRAAAWFFDDSANSWDRATVRGGRGDASIVSVVAAPGAFLAVGYDSPNGNRDAAVWASTDGRTWNRVPTQGTLSQKGSQVMRGIAFVPALGFVAVGVDESDAAVWISQGGVNWARSTRALGRGENRAMTGIVASDTHFIVVGQDQGRAAVWTAELPSD